jgi:hypothetical protein
LMPNKGGDNMEGTRKNNPVERDGGLTKLNF